tara:strand:- start:7607 stop:10150 length:2544 start_codon:yes stop_codon:yes gene_type:complete
MNPTFLKPVSVLLLSLIAGIHSIHGEATTAAMPERHFAVFEKYCLDCHDADTEKGEVNLDDLSFDLATDLKTAETWQKILDALNTGEMPPEDKKQLTAEDKTSFLDDLSNRIVTARKILSDNGGVVTLRRLNRREYANTLEALLGVRPDTSDLPDDQANSKFDTQGASLFFSSDQLEQYLSTARSTLELALMPPSQKPSKVVRIEPEEIYYPLYAELASRRLKIAQNYYDWQATGGRDDNAKEFGFLDGWQAGRNLDNFHISYPPLKKWLAAPENKSGAALMITIKDGFTSMKFPDVREWQPGKYVVRVRAGAYEEDPERFRYLEFVAREGQNSKRLGWRKVTASLKRPEVIEFTVDHQPGQRMAYWVQKRSHMDRGDKNLETEYRKETGYGTPWGIWIDWAELEGPIPAEPNEAAKKVLFSKSSEFDDESYAREVLRRFSEQAFRGAESTPEFLDHLVAQYSGNVAKGQKEVEALLGPLSIILSSPSFLYMVESTGNEDSEELTGVELAVRLSYFLWSAPPDEELMALAKEGKLKKPWNLEKQTKRLLADPRSDRFIRSFVYQWLEMERLGMFAFDGRDFPTFDNAARDAAGEEIYQTVSTLLKEKLPLGNLLKSDFVVVNDLLADYYGLEGVNGHHWRKVPVPDGSPRGGLLGSAAVSAMGSDGQRTSPVERGAWVLRHLLNNPPPPAPPNVPQLSRLEGEVLSARDLQKAHQEEPQCAQCHRKIDPIGYGMENFDAAGQWREVEVVRTGKRESEKTEFAIDPVGNLPGGAEFSTYFELRDAVADQLDGFARGLAEALISYGLGRPFGFTDHDLAQAMLEHAKAEDYAISAFVHALVQSKPFQTK